MIVLKSKFRSTFAALLLVLTPAAAQVHPSRAVRLIVPVTAGGLTDVLARAVTWELTNGWGQPVLAENRPGARHIIGTELVIKSTPDRYRLGA